MTMSEYLIFDEMVLSWKKAEKMANDQNGPSQTTQANYCSVENLIFSRILQNPK